MSVLCFLYLICSLRTKIVFATILASLFTGFSLLTSTFWYAADGNSAVARRTVFMAGLVTLFRRFSLLVLAVNRFVAFC